MNEMVGQKLPEGKNSLSSVPSVPSPSLAHRKGLVNICLMHEHIHMYTCLSLSLVPGQSS